jgi:hypothetical protein
MMMAAPADIVATMMATPADIVASAALATPAFTCIATVGIVLLLSVIPLDIWESLLVRRHSVSLWFSRTISRTLTILPLSRRHNGGDQHNNKQKEKQDKRQTGNQSNHGSPPYIMNKHTNDTD